MCTVLSHLARVYRASLWEAVSCWEGAREDLSTSAGEKGGNSALPSQRVE